MSPQPWRVTDLEGDIGRRCGLLGAQGLGPGDLVLAPDVPARDLAIQLWAVRRLGAALLPYRASRVDQAIRRLTPDCAAEWSWDPLTQRLTPTGLRRAPAVDGAAPAADLALLVATSGSSGSPKLVMHAASGLRAAAAAACERLAFGADDTWLVCLRLSHIGGLAILERCAQAGAACLALHAFDAARVAALLASGQVTHVSLVPPMLARLLELGCVPAPALRVVLVGGQALSRQLAERALAAGWPLRLTYGLTEMASQVATSADLGGCLPAAGLVGPALAGIAIAAPGCDAAPSPLRLRGPQQMLGYASPSRAAGLGLEDGWVPTADLGCLDAQGRLWVVGRADDVFIIGGSNVSRRAVEDALLAAPGVGELVVLDQPDPVWGHRLIAVYAGSASPEQLASWCEAHLTGPQRPRAWVRYPRLPLLDSGKYDRQRLAAEIADRAVGHDSS